MKRRDLLRAAASLTAAAEILLGERKPSGSLPAIVPGVFSIGAGMRDFA